MTDTGRRWAGLVIGLAFTTLLAWWSYRRGGMVFALLEAARDGNHSIDILRAYLATWGAFGPIAYVLLVIVEVLVAPLPGTLLYAPGGALFGGFLGGTFSLAGNTIGAGIACLIARTWGEPIARRVASSRMSAIRAALTRRGLWLILLLRLNPLTSSDLVSYAAGLVGMPVWKVIVGTFVGMAPLCYGQAYLADRIFRVLPGSLWAVVGLGVAYAAAVLWIVLRHQPAESR
jgi:uncharacterized membrane protein YdjX (TVP38/TMEM64 family)